MKKENVGFPKLWVYRIGKTKYAMDLTGTGAKLNGGRWNHEGTPCIYTAESRALALVEYTAHVSEEEIPRALSFTTYTIPENSILILTAGQLPGNWRDWPYAKEPRDFGTTLLNKAEYLVIKIPSAVIPEEFNYLLNPLHPLISKVKIAEVKDYAYDLRLKQNQVK